MNYKVCLNFGSYCGTTDLEAVLHFSNLLFRVAASCVTFALGSKSCQRNKTPSTEAKYIQLQRIIALCMTAFAVWTTIVSEHVAKVSIDAVVPNKRLSVECSI